ncbi:MAG TPA: SdrD B-like domain-containing protein, partial [Candidatus Bathyarchaeia archaeon]|nr:SdrD B-like domain-containing protein [Candidatus Bathyarchaeia archaeon]
SGTSSATASADTSGNYSFSGLANGSYTVTPSNSGFSFNPGSQNVTVNGASMPGINFSSATATTFSVSGTISGSGGNGTTVTLSGTATATVTANASGAYTFTGLNNGSYTVTPSKTGFIFTPASQAVTVAGANMAAVNFTSTAKLAIDKTVSTDRSSSAATIASPAFTSAAANELLLAFISADGPTSGTNTTVSSIAGGGLTWALVRRTNTQIGTAEVWRAFAPAVLTNVTVTATLSSSMAASMTVVTLTGVDTTGTGGSGAIGATASGNASSGAPTASLTTTRNNSWVFGVGDDWDNSISRTLGANQTMVHQYLATVGDTYWVQRQTATTPTSGTVVTINDTAPTGDRYNLTVVEVLPSL